MVRLFLKFYGVLIATLVLSFLVQGWVIDYVWRHADGFDFRVRFVPTFALIEHALAEAPPEAAAARFAEITRGFGLPARLEATPTSADRARMGPTQVARFEAGEIVVLDRAGGGFTLARRMPPGDRLAALDMPGLDSSRVKLITYAANWAIEFSLVAMLVWFWVRPFWRELLGLRRAAEAVGRGDFEVPAQTGRRSVLRDVAQALNRTASQVGTLLQSHRTLTSAISHELRTPMARLRFSHAMARDDPTPEGKDRFLARMESDLVEIDQLTGELLDYARLERGTPELALQNVPAEPWLEDVLGHALADPAAGSAPVRVSAQVDGQTLRCEPRYMARAVANLVRNARAHAAAQVRVTVEARPDGATVHVDDDGPGIAAEDRERIFEPFVRADASRARDSGGFGLGLAIVRQVARWHGGEARVSDSPLGGARVSLSW
jgi:two-component system sensor kinase ParS